jgi:hypothetical protein
MVINRHNGGIPPMMERIRMTSGDYKGRYIGLPVGSGLATNPVQKNPPVNVPGTRYGLVVQEQAATEFFEGNVGAVQTDLTALGYESELVVVKYARAAVRDFNYQPVFLAPRKYPTIVGYVAGESSITSRDWRSTAWP